MTMLQIEERKLYQLDNLTAANNRNNKEILKSSSQKSEIDR